MKLTGKPAPFSGAEYRGKACVYAQREALELIRDAAGKLPQKSGGPGI